MLKNACRGFSATEVYIIYVTVYFLLIVAGFIALFDLSAPSGGLLNVLSVASMFDFFVFELVTVCFVGALFVERNVYLRSIVYLAASVFILVYGVQFIFFYKGKKLISQLAIENINHISLVVNTKIVLGLLFLLSVCLVLIVIVEKHRKNSVSKENNFLRASIFFSIGFLLFFGQQHLPDKILKQRETYLFQNFMLHTSPLKALYEVFINGQDTASSEFDSFELLNIHKNGFHLDLSKQYPLVKDSVYPEEVPFKLIGGITEQPDIIVFFSEGISARAMSMYDSALYPDLTPNLEDFSKKSMVVYNYYNHTAATYRGLLGQLCSLFPAHTKIVEKARYFSLANIFNASGYETVFLDAHDKTKAHVNNLMLKIGFENVLTGVPLAEKYLDEQQLHGGEALSDNQFLKSLVGFLKERQQSKTSQKPLFLCLYNLGTHAYKRMSSDGKKYNQGENLSLNTIHNYDYAFGTFWDYFQTSPYADNTIVIFTADHAHYPENPFVEAFDQPGYQPLLVDQIPLIIYDPTRKLPKSFNAQYSTSIDFAPSLLHYLQLYNEANPFMGTSIFATEKQKEVQYGVAQFGAEVYVVDDVRVHKSDFSIEYAKHLALLGKFIKYSQHLEATGKLWKVEAGKERIETGKSQEAVHGNESRIPGSGKSAMQ